MALVKFIAATKSQTSGGLWGTLRYCCREEKTAYEGRHLVTGVNCVAETAYQEFMNTKRMYDKNDGRMFYHMIQSFKPGENLTPQTAHEIALKMAEQFPGFEILVATHTDREHIHSHFIINSVNADTGKKYHSNLESLLQLREVSDQLCLAYGLSVIQPKHRKTPGMSAREYRSADKGQSWKLQMAITIEDAMTMARSRGHFISLMELEGYQVRWSKDRKYITYTDPRGNKCRDIRLHEEKYRKENMEREFRIRSQILGRNESQTARFAAAGGESTSLRRRDRTQLGSDDRLPESPDRDAGRDAKYAVDPDHKGRTVEFSESAANHSDGEWQQKQIHDERCGKAGGKVYRWTYQSVKNVLVEESYTGLLVNHQTETYGRTVTPVPEDEQYRHEDFYPVIIDREEWEQVQALLKANARPYRGNTASHRYAGLLVCGDCGSTFVPRIRCWNGSHRVEYLCKSYMHHGKEFCPSHRIRETKLDAKVRQYAEELRIQWTAEQADLRRHQRRWEMKRPAINAHIADLYNEIKRLDQEIDDLLLEKIQSCG